MTLQDSKAATVADCGAHFYLSEADEGKNRAEACHQMMQELNPGVRVTTLAGSFPADLSGYSVVVAVDLSLEEALQADAACRAATPPIAFIRADIRGLAASVFVDLGPSFTCLDPTGESIKSAIVEHLALSKPGPVWPAGAEHAAEWQRLPEAWGSLRRDLAPRAASGAPAG